MGKIPFACPVYSDFLDNIKDKSYIKKQLQIACELAIKNGNAIAIGHVGDFAGDVTAESISEYLPEIDAKKVQLVFVSELEN